MTSIELEKGELYDLGSKRVLIVGPGAMTHLAMAQSLREDIKSLNALIALHEPIERRNHPRYDSLLEEYALIRRKESKLPRRKRDEIVARVHGLIETGGLVLPK